MKTLIQLDNDGYFLGTTFADESPLEPGVYLFPANTIDAELPNIPENMRAKWENGWIFEQIEIAQDVNQSGEIFIPTYKNRRAAEYPHVSEYLDGIVKGDQSQIQKYIDDCLAVKAKYPKE